MPSWKAASQDYGKHDSNEGTIVLNTKIGQYKANWESCPARSQNSVSSDQIVDVVKCLGIPYASIPYRWAAPRMSHPSPGTTRDCTEFGPQCPQANDPLFDVQGLPVFGPHEADYFPVTSNVEDEFNCLNLNIFGPLDIVRKGEHSDSKIPVLVWIHGGAYWAGTGGVDLYDATEIVARSSRIGTPVIVVTCNYRLGVLGWLHSRELALDSAQQVDVPPHFRSSANLGLLDAYMAIEWVKNHISDFGGDPQNITGIGESAGAVILNLLAVYPHLHVHIPRMILSSSTILSNQMLRATEAQTWFDAICEKNEVTLSVSALRDLPVHTLILKSNFARSAYRPIWDDVTITYDPRIVINTPGLWDNRLDQIMFGHCENESWLRFACLPSGGINSNSIPTLENAVQGRVPPADDLRERAMRIYANERAGRYRWYDGRVGGMASDSAVCWMALEGHARYYAVTELLSKAFVNSLRRSDQQRLTYKYIFGWTPKQWPEDWPATHTADILPAFLHKRLPISDIQVCQSFADELINFTAGRQDLMRWRRYDGQEPYLNLVTKDGRLKYIREGDGEFGLDAESLSLWKDVVDASIILGRKAWTDASELPKSSLVSNTIDENTEAQIA